MDRLNYNHLYYFWVVAREGGIARACEVLELTQPTISAQLRALERALGEKLFQKSGRGLALTEMGHVVFKYASEIFSLGREMLDTLQSRPTGRPIHFAAGIADIVPKIIAHRILEPALRMVESVQMVCREDKPDRLLAELALHELDMVLSDSPVGASGPLRAFSHLLGECGVSVFGTAELAAKHRKGFPGSLQGVPFLAPGGGAALRRRLDQWFESRAVRPRIVGEFDDNALLNSFGARGEGLFVGPSVIEQDIVKQFQVRCLGPLDGVRERFYAITAERRLKNPAVLAITEAARRKLFGLEESDPAPA